MLNKDRKSWKEVRDQRRKENFVGRAEHLRIFKDNFVSDGPEYMVFSVTGEGGVGKSALLGQFENIVGLSDPKALVVTCDDRYFSPVSVMSNIAETLANADIRHKEFDERSKQYRDLQGEIARDPKAPHGAAELLGRGVTNLVIKSGRSIPGVNVLFEYVDERAAGETLSQLIDYGIKRWGNKDEVRLLRETDRVLTPLFVELIAKACEKHRLVLIFDVFEHTSQSLASWLLALFNFEYGEFDTSLSFVVAGRDPLEQHWTELSGAICHIALEPFTLDETRLYLTNQDITDDQLITQIHKDTEGLPVLIELLAATKPRLGVPLPDFSRDAVERFLQWTSQEDRRRVCLLAAVPRQFNLDILTTSAGSDVSTVFSWLAAQSFLRRDTERGWCYHEKVRGLMLRHLQGVSPKELRDAHARLAEYFRSEQVSLGLEEEEGYESELWRKWEYERVYHIINLQPDKNAHEAINACLHAFRWKWQVVAGIIKACQQVGHEQASSAIDAMAISLSRLYTA
ncbi:MAG: hypothetical protein ACREAC_03080, partial [Blastocatellia bacterium]